MLICEIYNVFHVDYVVVGCLQYVINMKHDVNFTNQHETQCKYH